MKHLAPRSLPALAPILLTLAACGGASTPEIPDDPVGTVREIERRMEQSDATIVWDLLPESRRADVEETVVLFADTMDPALWDGVVDLAGDVAGLLSEQQPLLLEMARNDAEEDEEPFDEDEARRQLGTVAEALDALVSSDLATLDSLREMDVRAFLAGAPSRLMALAMAEAEQPNLFGVELEPGSPLAIELVEEGEATAVLELSSGGDAPERLEMVRVEGHWMPAEMAADWEQQVAEARAAIEGMFEGEDALDRAQLAQLLGTVGGIVDGLRVAETPEEFEQTLQQGVFSVLGAVMASGLAEAFAGAGEDDGDAPPFTYEVR